MQTYRIYYELIIDYMLSIVILAKNEERTIQTCLSTLPNHSELILIDNESTDGTLTVAKRFGARVVPMKGSDFAQMRNRGMREAKHSWVLYIDGDEIITEPLRDEIEKAVIQSDCSSFYIKRRDFWWGKELRYGEIYSARNRGIIRLMKKGSGRWEGAVHERFVSYCRTGRLKSFLDHLPDQRLQSFIKKINFYSSLRALELKRAHISPSFIDLMILPVGKFIYTFFIRLGFLDGPQGFVYSFLMSFHSFLSRAKVFTMKE